jgi:hypothetical protein
MHVEKVFAHDGNTRGTISWQKAEIMPQISTGIIEK